MTIQRFGEEQKLKISRDECGGVIVRGKRGHLYVDGEIASEAPGQLCRFRDQPLGALESGLLG
jgi:hypothetical protein